MGKSRWRLSSEGTAGLSLDTGLDTHGLRFKHEDRQFDVKTSPTESLSSQPVNGNTLQQFPHRPSPLPPKWERSVLSPLFYREA